MSTAFIREIEYRKLEEIQPTISSLENYLTQENGGMRIYEKKNYFNHAIQVEIFEMTNGLEYHKKFGYWKVLL